MDHSLDLHDWIFVNHPERIGQVWAIHGSFLTYQFKDHDGLLNMRTIAIHNATKITKEVADIMRAV